MYLKGVKNVNKLFTVGIIVIVMTSFLFFDEYSAKSLTEKEIEERVAESVNRIVLGESVQKVEKELNENKLNNNISNVSISVNGKRTYGEKIVISFKYDYKINSWLRTVFNRDVGQTEKVKQDFYQALSS